MPPKKGRKRKAKFVKGNPSHRKAKVCKKDPCDIPKECENRDPQDYENWVGTRKITLTKHADLKEVIEGLKDLKSYMLAFYREERKDLEENFKELKKYEVSEFMLHLLGEKVLQGSAQDSECLAWRYTEWEYKKELTEEEKKVYTENYPNRYEEHFETWTGDGSQTSFNIEDLPSDKEKEIEDDDITMKVVVGNIEKQEGDDYIIDRKNKQIIFVKGPPELNIGIRADYFFPKIGPGHPTKGSCLEIATYPTKIDTGKIHFGKFGLSASLGVDRSTVAVFVGGKAWEGDYEIEIERFWPPKAGKIYQTVIVFKDSYPKADEEIVVAYADVFNRRTQDYVRVNEVDFEATRRVALKNVIYFIDIVRNSNSTKYDKLLLSNKNINLEMVRKWIKEDWHSYYPSRELKEREEIHKIDFYFRCNNPTCPFAGKIRPISQSIAGETKGVPPKCCGEQTEKVVLFRCVNSKENCELAGKHFPLTKKDAKAPKCTKCKAQTELLKHLYETTVSQSVVLDLTEEKENGKISEQLETTYDLENFPVYFETARPRPGDPDSEREDLMLSKQSMRMEEVSGKFYKQLIILKNEAKVRRLPIIRFWGFADKRGKCDFNDGLSLRRAQWVRDRLEHILTKNFDIKVEGGFIKLRKSERIGGGITIGGGVTITYVEIARYPRGSGNSELIGCGEGLADVRAKKGGYKPEEHRAVIIETWLFEPRARLLKY